MSGSIVIGNGVDIDDTVTLGKGVVVRDLVTLKHVIVEDGVKIGRGTFIFGSAEHPVYIGKNSYISPNCYFNGASGLKIEGEVTIAAGVMIFSDSGPNVGPLMQHFGVTESEIVIGKGCWIGAGSILLPGAELDSEAVLAANSTLKTKVGYHQIYGGNIAKLIKEF